MRISINVDEHGTYSSTTETDRGTINATGDTLEMWAVSFATGAAQLHPETHACHEMYIHLGNISDRAADRVYDKIADLVHDLDRDPILDDADTPLMGSTKHPGGCGMCREAMKIEKEIGSDD